MRINNLIARFLVNKTTKEEWDTLEAWKQESQENLNELLEMQSIWNNSVDMQNYKTYDKKSAWDAINDQIEEEAPASKGKVVNMNWIASIAAAIALVIFSVFTFTNTTPEGHNRIAAVDIIENVSLPDGSTISMNKHSELNYAANFENRREIILDGEAYFNVARDEAHPFTIETDHAEVTVLGTSFNIQEKEESVDVYVTSGKVKVTSGTKEVILSKYQMVNCKDGVITELANPGRNYLSWKSNRLEFSDTPLHLVVSDLRRHYGKNLSFSSDSKAMNQLVSDVFENEDFEGVLETLVLITGIKYHKEGSRYVIE